MARQEYNDRENQLRVEGRFATLYWPRCATSPHQHTRHLVFLLVLSLAAVAIGVILDLSRLLLLGPLAAVVVVVEGARWYHTYHVVGHTRRQDRDVTLWAPLLATWILAVAAPAFAMAVNPKLWVPTQLLVAAWTLCRFATLVCNHYMSYLTAHHGLSYETQEKWRLAFSKLWLRFPRVRPARSNLTDEERRLFSKVLAAFAGFRLRYFAVLFGAALIAAPFFFTPMHVPQRSGAVILVAEFLLLLAHTLFVYIRHGISMWPTLRALEVFLVCPPDIPESSIAPWSPRSPSGHAKNRRDQVVFSIVLFSALLIPVTTFFPLYAATSDSAVFRDYSAHIPNEHPAFRTTASIVTLAAAAEDGRGPHALSVAIMSAITAACLSTGLFLLTLHFVSGPTFFFAWKLLDNDSP